MCGELNLEATTSKSGYAGLAWGGSEVSRGKQCTSAGVIDTSAYSARKSGRRVPPSFHCDTLFPDRFRWIGEFLGIHTTVRLLGFRSGNDEIGIVNSTVSKLLSQELCAFQNMGAKSGLLLSLFFMVLHPKGLLIVSLFPEDQRSKITSI